MIKIRKDEKMKDKRYDLNLGDFGPYNKQYYGVCHVADKDRGATFNVELFPGFFRRSVLAGDSKSDTGIKLWGANPDLTRFCYRYELQWKDEIYCDVDFNITNDTQADITCTFVNNTDLNQSLDVTLAASLQLPIDKPGSETVGFLTFFRPVLPEGVICIDATEHDDIKCRDTVAPDGKFLGEEEMGNTTGKGTAIDGYYFYLPEHFLKYNLNKKAKRIGVRYRTKVENALDVSVNGTSYRLPLQPCKDFDYAVLDIPETDITELRLSPENKMFVDCICVGDDADKVTFEAIPHNLTPEKTVGDGSMTLKYKDIPQSYTIKWYEPIRMQRRCHGTDIGKLLQLNVNDHVSSEVSGMGMGKGLYEALLSTPIYLAPGESEVRRFRVFTGQECEPVPHTIETVKNNPDGEPYAFSQNMMRYNTLLNVVYPIYTRRQFIKHNAPGRFWNSLYSWDSGFIGMGLSSADFGRGFDCLNTYLTPVGDRHSPYIFHGSVVPTQIFLYKHLVDSFPEKRAELCELYPMVKQYYCYYSEMDKQEDQLASGILKTWRMSYNSGGWDDYPPQHELRNAKYTEPASHKNTTPVITTANTVLISKIMAEIAGLFGFGEDIPYYTATAKKYAAKLPQLWDEEVGYFSYMIHDEKGQPREFYRYSDGTNYNMGMDGVTPYIADVCTPHQEEKIEENIRLGLMTDIGVGVVDKRAPYYSPYGYWNGSVWMPHQWILWKSLIDRGNTDLAFEIASKSLNVWKNEVEATYCCFENFMCHNGRGSGYHHFSGLSCPISLFFESYYTPGKITSGWNSIIRTADWNADKTSLTLTADAVKDGVCILVCMNSAKDYSFTVNGKPVTPVRLTDGAYSITLRKGENKVEIN